jgi:hypothetical protein
VVQLGKDFGLTLKPSQAFRVTRDRLGQDLDRDLPLQPGVGGLIDLPHAADAKERRDLVGTNPCSGLQRHATRG